MKRYVVAGKSLGIALALAVPLLALFPPAGGKAAPDGEALFEKKCGLCHGLSQTTTRREWKQEWAKVVHQMVRKRDGWISAEEAEAIVDYLASAYGRE
jgi:mono/diheme cytochrome c family protein